MLRLVICLDVEANTLEAAYGRVHRFMRTLPDGWYWESTDEAFDHHGEVIPPDDIQKARGAFHENRSIGNEPEPEPSNDQPKLADPVLSVEGVHRLLGEKISLRQVYLAMDGGGLRFIKIGRRQLSRVSWVDEWLNSSEMKKETK